MMYSNEFAQALYEALEGRMAKDHLQPLIEKPKHLERGDLAFPCFSLAKIERKSPQLIAEEMSRKVNSPLFEKVEAAGGYLNVFLNKQKVTAQVLEEVLAKKIILAHQTVEKEKLLPLTCLHLISPSHSPWGIFVQR